LSYVRIACNHHVLTVGATGLNTLSECRLMAIFHDPVLMRSLSQGSFGNKRLLDILDNSGYAKWICDRDDSGSKTFTKLRNHVWDVRGIPYPPWV
jgi:hypothetical protein